MINRQFSSMFLKIKELVDFNKKKKRKEFAGSDSVNFTKFKNNCFVQKKKKNKRTLGVNYLQRESTIKM